MPKSLKQFTKCLREQEKSNFSLLTQISNAKDYALETLRSFIPDINILGSIENIVKGAKLQLESVKLQLEGEFDSFVDQIENTRDAITGNLIVKCINNDEVTEKQKIDVVSTAASNPRTNDDEINNSSEQVKNAKDFDDSKTQSIDEIANTITEHVTQKTNVGIKETRELVKKYSGIHPILDEYTKNLPLFQPVSDYIGSSVIGYTPDKYNLLLKDWNNLYPIIENWSPSENPPPNAPGFFKRTLANKLDKEIVEMSQISYENLNRAFTSNLSRQLKDEVVGGGISHSAYIIGDYNFSTKTIPNISKKVEEIIVKELGESAILNNFLYPLDTQIESDNDFYVVDIEGESVKVDKRGNVIYNNDKKVNNSIFNVKG